MKQLATLLACAGLLSQAFSAQAAELTGRLQSIKNNNYVTVGYRDSSVPFSYVTGKGDPLGYGWEICGKIVDEIRAEIGSPQLEIRKQAITSQNRIPLIQNGTVDLECGTTVNNPERQSSVSFSVTYFVVGTRFVARKSENLSTLQDLKGKTVVVTTGSNTATRVRQIDRKENLKLKIVQAKDFYDSMLVFTSGRADAFFEDDINIAGQLFLSQNPGDYAISKDALSRDPYAVMLPHNDPAFKAVADRAITKLFKSGEINRLYDKWFMQPIPPKGTALNFPMGPALSHVIAHPTDSPNPADY